MNFKELNTKLGGDRVDRPKRGLGRINTCRRTVSDPIGCKGGPLAGIDVLESRPANITLHRIEDHELELLMNISRPVALSVATTSVGVFVGLIPSTIQILKSASQQRPVSLDDLGILSAAIICRTIGIVTGFLAGKGQIQARRTLAAIRARPVHPFELAAPHLRLSPAMRARHFQSPQDAGTMHR